MSSLISLIASLAVATVNTAHAQPMNCRDSLKIDAKESHFVVIPYKDRDGNIPTVTQEMLDEISDLYKQVLEKINSDLIIPDKLTLDLFYQKVRPFPIADAKPSFNALEKKALLPYRYLEQIESGVATFSLLHTRGVQLHEIGHGFLDAHASLASASWKSFKKIQSTADKANNEAAEIGALMESLLTSQLTEEQFKQCNTLWNLLLPQGISDIIESKRKLLLAEVNGDSNPIEKSKLLADFKEHSKKLDDQQTKLYQFLELNLKPETYQNYIHMIKKYVLIQNEQRHLEKELFLLQEILSPYDEFFADTFAVVLLKNPNAIDSRDFTENRPLEKIPDEAPGPLRIQVEVLGHFDLIATADVNGTRTKWGLDENFKPHTLLNPTRSYFWQNYASKKTYMDRPGLTLKHLQNAIISEIETRMSNPHLLRLSPRETNRRFIEAIDREMFKMPL